MHVASSYYYDVEPCLKAKIPVIWVNRNKETARRRARRSRPPRSRPSSRRPSCSARPRVACGPSGCTPTSSSSRRASGRRRARSCARASEAFCIDSPVLPGRARDRCPRSPSRPGFRVVGLLATHADWDHLLGRYAFPEAPLGVAETTAARLRNEPGDGAARAARVRRGVLRRAARAAVAAAGRRRCRCRATAGSASASSSCIRPTGTPPTGWRSGSRGRACSSCGDYLSPVEIPMVSEAGSRRAPTSRRSTGSSRWSSRPTTSCPATAGRSTPTRALAILREDRAYLRGAAAAADAAAAARAPHRRAAQDPRGERRRESCRATQPGSRVTWA